MLAKAAQAAKVLLRMDLGVVAPPALGKGKWVAAKQAPRPEPGLDIERLSTAGIPGPGAAIALDVLIRQPRY